MIEREPFIIRNGMRIFSVVVVVGLVALIVIGIRFQIENAEFANEEHRLQSRPSGAVELQGSCEFFGGQYLGMPALPPRSAAPNLTQVCNLAGTAAERLQCDAFEGAYGRNGCSVDIGAMLQAIPRTTG